MLTKEQQNTCWRPARNDKFEWDLSKRRMNAILDYDKDIFKDKTIIDMGCGHGIGTQLIRDNGAKQVIGIDINDEAIQYAKETTRDNAILFKTGLIYKTEFKDDSVDGITCIETIEHNDKDEFELALNEWYRILKPGGFVWLTTPRKRFDRKDYPLGNGDHWIEYTSQEIREIVSKTKFIVTSEMEVHVDMISIGMILTKPN